MGAAITLYEEFVRATEQFADGTAVVDGDRRTSYLELGSLVDRVANGLACGGLGKGDRIAIWMPNRLEWIVTFFAATAIGAVVVPVNTGLSIDETRYILEQSGSSTLVVQRLFRGRD